MLKACRKLNPKQPMKPMWRMYEMCKHDIQKSGEVLNMDQWDHAMRRLTTALRL